MPIKSNFGKKGFGLAHSSILLSITVEKSQQLELETADYITSLVRNKKKRTHPRMRHTRPAFTHLIQPTMANQGGVTPTFTSEPSLTN